MRFGVAGLAFCATALLAANVRLAASAGPAIGPGSIAASVRDGDGKPVARALVTADGPASREATTSAAGIVTLVALPLGTYSVRVERAGFVPYATLVKIASARDGPRFLQLRLVKSSFANLSDAANLTEDIALSASADPFTSHALVAAPEANVVSVASPAGAAPTLMGTSPGETRVELDGIPLAGGSQGFAALRFRNALALDDVELLHGPALPGSSQRNAIGGIVNYQTPQLDRSARAGAVLGYDSAFGSFTHARLGEGNGKFGVLADVIAGGGENRSQTVKVRYALSSATSLAIAKYGSQTSAGVGGADVRSTAPAFAFDLRTKIGSASLQARTYESSARTSESSARTSGGTVVAGSDVEDARNRGLQIAYELPLGDSMVSVGFDRRGERSADFSTAPPLEQTFTTVTAHTDIRLSERSRLELGDAYAGGTLLAKRHDPQIAFARRLTERTTLRMSAGSAYATAPDDVLQRRTAADQPLVPETSFGYRLGVDTAPAGGDRLWSSLFALRRFGRFAALPDARSLGVDVGYERAAIQGRVGVLAYVEAHRTAYSGLLRPASLQSDVLLPAYAARTFEGDAGNKARLALSWHANAFDASLGTTVLSGSALRSGAIALGDASLRVPLGDVLVLRAGIQNAFGQHVTEPRLAPLFAPREITLTFGRLGN